MAEPFRPTWQWHVKVWAVLLVLCTAALGLLSCVRRHLPAPYQRYTPPAETTPWLGQEVSR